LEEAGGTTEVMGKLGPAAVAVFLLYVRFPWFSRADLMFAGIWGGLAAVFAFFAYWGFRHAWECK
jgi:hypothetical protein